MELNNRIQLSKNLYLDEYIPKDLYLSSTQEELIKLINPKLIKSDQILRDIFGPVVINTWWDNMHDNIPDEDQHMSFYRGFRPANCKIGARFSDHKKGTASDKLFKNATANDVRKYICENDNYKKLGITKIEMNVSWVHTSVQYTGKPQILKFFP